MSQVTDESQLDTNFVISAITLRYVRKMSGLPLDDRIVPLEGYARSYQSELKGKQVTPNDILDFLVKEYSYVPDSLRDASVRLSRGDKIAQSARTKDILIAIAVASVEIGAAVIIKFLLP